MQGGKYDAKMNFFYSFIERLEIQDKLPAGGKKGQS